jgi:hypothetical protein
MHIPHHHRDETYLAISDPTHVVFEVAICYTRSVTKVATHSFTFKMTVECHLTRVPATGSLDTTVVHLVEFSPGPRVSKYNAAFAIAAYACAWSMPTTLGIARSPSPASVVVVVVAPGVVVVVVAVDDVVVVVDGPVLSARITVEPLGTDVGFFVVWYRTSATKPWGTVALGMASDVGHCALSFATANFAVSVAQLCPMSPVGTATSVGPLEMVTVISKPDLDLVPAAGDWLTM